MYMSVKSDSGWAIINSAHRAEALTIIHMPKRHIQSREMMSSQCPDSGPGSRPAQIEQYVPHNLQDLRQSPRSQFSSLLPSNGADSMASIHRLFCCPKGGALGDESFPRLAVGDL